MEEGRQDKGKGRETGRKRRREEVEEEGEEEEESPAEWRSWAEGKLMKMDVVQDGQARELREMRQEFWWLMRAMTEFMGRMERLETKVQKVVDWIDGSVVADAEEDKESEPSGTEEDSDDGDREVDKGMAEAEEEMGDKNGDVVME
jgi:hypothetical protein